MGAPRQPRGQPAGGSRWRGGGGRRHGKGGGGRDGLGAEDTAAAFDASLVDPARAKPLLFSWLQRARKIKQPAEYVSLEPSRSRRGHACTAWVWEDDCKQWSAFVAPGAHASRQDAVAAAYARAVVGLGVPVPKECVLSEEAQARLRARGAEEVRRARAAERRQQVVAAATRALEAELIAAFFPDAHVDPDGFCTPREREDETMPESLPARLVLPSPVEARSGDERGNRGAQQLKLLARKEPQMLQGPSIFETHRQMAGSSENIYVCICAMLFDQSVAVVGVAYGTKKAAVRAAAATAALARLDAAAQLPSREEAGEHAAAVAEIRRFHQLQPFKIWALEGTRPNDTLCWRCALRGQVPFQGRLREFWGDGADAERATALALACATARGHLTRLLGCADCVEWLQAVARVHMEVEELPEEVSQSLANGGTDDGAQEYAEKLREWFAVRQARACRGARPPGLAAGAAPTAPQVYEPQADGGDLELTKAHRGVPKLPVMELRNSLSEVLGDGPCVVISGGTGSGKSTQIPQYIVDDFQPGRPGGAAGGAASDAGSTDDGANGDPDGSFPWCWPARVVVTEPRRIAAVSLAERVAWERGEPLGKSVGYSVRGDSRPPARGLRGATLEYCTVGILLRRLQTDPRLRQVSHVLVDEVHERDIMTDFVLVLLKELLCVRSDFRVVLMSATLDVGTFTSYLWSCPCLEIPSGPRFEVEDVHLDDDAFRTAAWAGDLPSQLLWREEEGRRAVEDAKDGDEDGHAEGADEPAYRSSANAWWGSAENDDTYVELVARLVMDLAEGPALVDDDGRPGSVLCFFPGWAEIRTCMDRLQELDHRQSLWQLPLHSTLPKADQQLIFQHPPAGKTKVILATNIAESSVTIDDVLVVVDAGLMREAAYDPVRRLSTLETVWVSQSSAIQRMGRAGRVRRGRCFRLYSRAQLEQSPWRTTPEMQRCELSNTCLQALALRREARDFLARTPDPPTRAAVETALDELIQLGAICAEAAAEDEEAQDGDWRGGRNGVLREQLMPLGETVARMTVSPILGRMLILGALFGATSEACLLAAVVSAPRRVFVCPPGKKKESLAAVRGFSKTSDTLAAYTACVDFEGWIMACKEGFAERWAADLFLVPKRLKQLLAARDMHHEELRRAGLVPQRRGGSGRCSRGGGAWAAESAEAREEVQDGLLPDAGELAEGGEQAEAGGRVTEDMELVKALLVAAYPQNLALRRRVQMAKHNTATGLDAIIAPQSVNAPPKAKTAAAGPRSEERVGSWWCYGSMQISNGQGFLRTTTLVDAYHVALFGGLSLVEDDSGALRELDGWIELRGPRWTLRALARLRRAVTQCIDLRALDPQAPLPESARRALQEVAKLLRSAAPRHDRLASLLPEGPAQRVERPPAAAPPAAASRRLAAAAERGGSRWDTAT